MEKLIILGVPFKLFSVLDYIYRLVFKLSDIQSALELEWCSHGWGENVDFCLNKDMIPILSPSLNFRMSILAWSVSYMPQKIAKTKTKSEKAFPVVLSALGLLSGVIYYFNIERVMVCYFWTHQQFPSGLFPSFYLLLFILFILINAYLIKCWCRYFCSIYFITLEKHTGFHKY